MVKQYIEARTQSGYQQLSDYKVYDNDLRKLQMSSYQKGAGVGDPIQYCAYADILDNQRVWVEGTNTLVPAGMGESGGRDTSITHKFIYSEDDYERKLCNPKGEYIQYYHSVEEYRAQSGQYIRDEDEAVNYVSLRTAMGFSNQIVEDFVCCCIDAFMNKRKRVYCFLPSSDRIGSIYARQWMEYILSFLPKSIVAESGYITYFHGIPGVNVSETINGRISVLFLPRNEMNERDLQGIANVDYVFDVQRYKLQWREPASKYVNMLLKAIEGDEQSGKWIKTVYSQIDKWIINSNNISVPHISVFFEFLLVNTNQKEIVRGDLTKLENYSVSLQNCLILFGNMNDAGKEIMRVHINTVLMYYPYSQNKLKLIGQMAQASQENLEMFVKYLSDACGAAIKEGKEQRVWEILDYPYAFTMMRKCLESYCMQEYKYFEIVKFIYCNRIQKILNTDEVGFAEKKSSMYSFLGKLMEENKSFACSQFGVDLVNPVLDYCIANTSGNPIDEFEFMYNSIGENNKELFATVYWKRYTQEKAYNIFSEYCKTIDENNFSVYSLKSWLKFYNTYELEEYESNYCGNAERKNTYLEKLIEQEEFRAFIEAEDIRKIVAYLIKHDNESFDICMKYENLLISIFENNRYYRSCNKNDFVDFCEYMFLFTNRDVRKEILRTVYQLQRLQGVLDFYLKINQKEKIENMYEIDGVFAAIINGKKREWLSELKGEYQILLSDKQKEVLECLGILIEDVPEYCKEVKRVSEPNCDIEMLTRSHERGSREIIIGDGRNKMDNKEIKIGKKLACEEEGVKKLPKEKNAKKGVKLFGKKWR